ncbi:c-type cytochrome [Chlorobium ferrooxidans]|uniref:Cytochrome c, class I n=1 Tax=Chlorobium ferrooxidans DSM 13031 TaxID=377431 RepID=Q0YPL9_9CHLB|nr:c-type cytochrome [Chlorobium ferrooxidans]EAT58216.1 Cytochrome c, class I [Chlorobium ferrooxidans DSM 13031]
MSRILSAALCSFVVFAFSSSDAFAANAAAGKSVYDASCATCHKTGLMGAPKFGDKAAWAPRIKQGLPVLVAHSIKGFQGKVGMMPPKGGNAKLTDQQIGDSVAYMVSGSK